MTPLALERAGDTFSDLYQRIQDATCSEKLDGCVEEVDRAYDAYEITESQYHALHDQIADHLCRDEYEDPANDPNRTWVDDWPDDSPAPTMNQMRAWDDEERGIG